jgi:hypothetical protein
MLLLRRLAVVAAFAALAACATREEEHVATLAATNATPADFSLCHGNSCRLHSHVSLSPAEWQQVRDLLTPADAIGERRQIALAIGRLEILAGRQAGTLDDAPGMGVHWDPDGQLDCVDEATNTTQYLHMLAADGLLRWHRVSTPSNRARLGLWPSNTATILETATGRRFAVDSYFLANGEPASVLPLDTWLTGWTPDDGPPPET